MASPVQLLWTPAGASIPNIGSRALADVSDGDTPNMRMPIRMLSIDTPEVTAKSEAGAERVDARFSELAEWIEQGRAPVSQRFAEHIQKKIRTGNAGTLQFRQGEAAGDWFRARIDARLSRPGRRRRTLFVWTADAPFDNYHRVLAYIAPNSTARERAAMTPAERRTFNLDRVASGWAAPFVIFPNIPGELDLPILIDASETTVEERLSQHADPLSLPAYEYRMCEKLHSVTKGIVEGREVSPHDRFGWRSRYAADMRDRTLHGPEEYMGIPAPDRLWIWPGDVQRAIAMLNPVPARTLVT